MRYMSLTRNKLIQVHCNIINLKVNLKHLLQRSKPSYLLNTLHWKVLQIVIACSSRGVTRNFSEKGRFLRWVSKNFCVQCRFLKKTTQTVNIYITLPSKIVLSPSNVNNLFSKYVTPGIHFHDKKNLKRLKYFY